MHLRDEDTLNKWPRNAPKSARPYLLGSSCVLTVALACVGCSCGDDETGGAPGDSGAGLVDASTDAGMGSDGATVQQDAGMSDSSAASCEVVRGVTVGGRCSGTCANRLSCEPFTRLTTGVIDLGGAPPGMGGDGGVPDAAGVDAMAPDAGPMIPACGEPVPAETGFEFPVFQGGLCTQECNPDNSDACGPCAVCTNLFLLGSEPLGTRDSRCRPVCTPSLTGRGGCPEGYACSIYGVCLNACTQGSNACKITGRDLDRDGRAELVLDPSLPSICDSATGLCSTPMAKPGDPCQADSECAPYSLCMVDREGQGRCVSGGCHEELGLACAPGEICDQRLHPAGICLKECTLGAEAMSLQLGVGGHGQGCAASEACRWTAAGDPSMPLLAARHGSCQPANYNDVQAPNIGAPCTQDSECYSPYGLGVCWFRSPRVAQSGYCAVIDCASGNSIDGILPGLAADRPVCPESDGLCVVRANRDNEPIGTICLKTCADPSDCLAGYGCVQLSSEPSPKLCLLECNSDADCHMGASCLNPDGNPCARNDPHCSCSDLAPRCR
ncbi:MAG: hypothetical protein MJD61_09115 [Proteobacteria bacterium]|nr:hypothetical protein [Pseudomonadota bacterium]